MSNPGIKLSKLVKLIEILDRAKHAGTPNAKESYVMSEIAKEDKIKRFLGFLCGGDVEEKKPKPEPKPVVEDGEPVKKD